MARVLPVLVMLLLASCGPSIAENVSDDSGRVADDAGIPVSKIRYFPPATEQPRVVCDYGRGAKRQPIIGEFENRWFSSQLTAAGEPSLYLAAKRSERVGPFMLRFTWLRSFHAPVFIRIEAAADGQYRLIAKELSGAGGYDPGTVKRRAERTLRPEEVQRLRQTLAMTQLFHIPPKDCDLGCDGAEWMFEMVDGQGYHVMTRWSPQDGPAREAGLLLMKLSGWSFGEVY